MHVLHSLLTMPVILRQEKAKTGNQARDGGQISGCIRFTPDCAVQNIGKWCKGEHLVDEVQKRGGEFLLIGNDTPRAVQPVFQRSVPGFCEHHPRDAHALEVYIENPSRFLHVVPIFHGIRKTGKEQ